MNRNLNKLIKESVREALLEMDILPTDDKGEVNLVRNTSVNIWRMIYNLMDNVKSAMDATWQDKNGRIAKMDISNIVDYIHMSMENILK